MKEAACRPQIGLLLCMGVFAFSTFTWGSTATAELAVPYTVRLDGVADDELRGTLMSVLETVELKDRPPATLLLLRRRAEGDMTRLDQALRARGYYSAEVHVAIEEQVQPVTVVFHVQLGQVYRIQNVTIEFEGTGAEPTPRVPSPEELGLRVGEPALSSAVIEAEKALIKGVRRQGFAFAGIEERKVVVDHATEGMRVHFIVNPGPQAHFGPIEVTGLESVEESFVTESVPWKKGDRFNPELLDELQKELVDTRLFSLVRVMPDGSLDAEGLLPVTIEVRERKHRTVRAGVRYQTDEGPGVKTEWENRNYLHRGETLGFSAIASGITYAGEGQFRKPLFLRRDQSLLINSRLARDDTDAYRSDNIEASAIVERELSDAIRVGAGPAFRLAEVDQVMDEEDEDPESQPESFVLFSLPTYLNMDTTESLLDPTAGGRLNVQATPFLESLNGVSFFKTYVTYSRYINLLERPRLIFAGRGAIGSIAGAEREDIPADVRFYAGGGGSIRGYPFQTVGPLDEDDDPIGGRSLLDLSAEFRLKFTETLGMVAFVDGGSAFESTYPDFSETIRWGTGAGIRYFTPVGPLRLDIAFPLNRRDDVDDSFQIYISIGQAF